MEGSMEIGSWMRVADAHPTWMGRVVKIDRVSGSYAYVGDLCFAHASLAPWVPRPGERVIGRVTSGVDIEGTCKSVETVGANTYVRWHESPQHCLSIATCAPVLDESGRPVMEAGWSFAPVPTRPVPHITVNGYFNSTDDFAAKLAAQCGVYPARVSAAVDIGIPISSSSTAGAATDEWLRAHPPQPASARPITAAEWSAEYLGTPRPAYQPRVGDRVSWNVDPTKHGTVIERQPGCENERAWPGETVRWDDSKPGGFGMVSAYQVTPLRPTAAGQRVRHTVYEREILGATESVHDGFARVVWDEGGRSVAALHHLVRIAAATPVDFGEGITWTQVPHVPADIVEALTRGPVQNWSASYVGELEPGEVSAPCGSTSHAQRHHGTTCTHFWPCGCAVEPEGEDCLGHVNGEPRGVLVWGHNAIGEGFTRDEAVSHWRRILGAIQRRQDDGGGWRIPDPIGAARAAHAARKALAMDASKVREGAMLDTVRASAAMVTAAANQDVEGLAIAHASYVAAIESMPPNTKVRS